MAKKKSASSTSATSEKTAATKKATATKATTSKASSNGSASSTSAPMSHEQIGFVAGDLWLYLSDNGESSLATLKKEINTSAELLCAAVGWLAREDKLDFNVTGKTVKVSLK